MREQRKNDRAFHGDPGGLRSPSRLAMLEVSRVTALCREGKDSATVLDVGTGTGVFAEAFAGAGARVTGIDLESGHLAIARTLVPGGTFLVAAAETLPFPDRSFDLVFLGHVLHESEDPLECLKEARRTSRWRVAVLEWPYVEEPSGPPLAHRLKEERVRELAERAGFRIVETQHLERMVLYRFAVGSVPTLQDHPPRYQQGEDRQGGVHDQVDSHQVGQDGRPPVHDESGPEGEG